MAGTTVRSRRERVAHETTTPVTTAVAVASLRIACRAASVREDRRINDIAG